MTYLIILIGFFSFLSLFIYLLNKRAEKQRLADELVKAKKEYGWRLDKLKELFTLSKELATNGNSDAKIIILGINECYLHNYLDSNPVTIIGYQTFVKQYDRFVEQYKENFNSLGKIVKSLSAANKLIKNIDSLIIKIDKLKEQVISEYNSILFFEVPKYDLQAKITNLYNLYNTEMEALRIELSAPTPNTTNINRLVSTVETSITDLQNALKSANLNIEFDKEMKSTANQAEKKIKEIQQDLLKTSKLDGVTEEHRLNALELVNNIGITLKANIQADLVAALQIYKNVQNASLPILKDLISDNKGWKQAKTRQAPPRPTTNSRVGTRQIIQNKRDQSRVQIQQHEDRIRRERATDNSTNSKVSSRNVYTDNTNDIVINVAADVAGHSLSNILIETFVNEDRPQIFNGGEFGGGGASGTWEDEPDNEQDDNNDSSDNDSSSDD